MLGFDATQIIKILSGFVFLYPIGMSIFWILGTVIYFRNFQQVKERKIEIDKNYPFTIVMPVHNEGDILEYNIQQNLKLNYDNFKLFIIDDCSDDNTFSVAKKWEEKDKRIQVFQTNENLGKANALNEMLSRIDTEYFICIDGDAYLDVEALQNFNLLINKYKKEKKNVGAITGQPKLIDGDESFIHHLQRVEYRSIISMIKKSQSLFKSIFSVSGVCTLYAKDALIELGGFNVNNQTEDIEITWRLQRNDYLVMYEPLVMVNMYTPNTFQQLLRQRIRWSIGGLQTINQNKKREFRKSLSREMKFYLIEFYVSMIWAFAFFISTFILVYLLIFGSHTLTTYLEALSPMIILGIYAFVLMYIGYKYEIGVKEDFRSFLKSSLAIALVYWIINPIALVCAFFKYYILNQRGGIWVNSRKT